MKRTSMGAASAALLASAILVPGALGQSPSVAPASPAASPAAAGDAHPAHIHSGTCTELGMSWSRSGTSRRSRQASPP